jgi:type IV pilus assembly protein PilM
MGFLSLLFPSPLIGLDIGVSGIKAVELTAGKTPRLIAYNRVPLPRDTITSDGEIRQKDRLVQGLKRLFEAGFSTKKVAVAAFGSSVMTKKVALPRMTEDELSHQLYWEAEQYIPFNIEEVNLDFAVLNSADPHSETMDVMLVAAKKDYVSSLKGLIESAGLEPEIVDSQSFALGNVFEFSYSRQVLPASINALIDFGAGSTKVTVVEGYKTTFTRELRPSGSACTQMISERLRISLEDAERLKTADTKTPEVTPLINEFIHSLVEELTRTIDFAVGQGVDRSLESIYVCGGGSRLTGLWESLTEKMPAPVQPLNPVQNIAGSGQKMNVAAVKELECLGAVAVGLALRHVGDAG